MKKLLFSVMMLVLGYGAQAQIADGSNAPDFTLTDIDGNTHTLYDYLNSGKTVFLEVFAAHCPTCWAYHQTETLKKLYNMYGPDATDEIMVLALEYDEGNDENAFVGIGQSWVTQGNWVDGTPYPLFNVEGADRSVFSDYQVAFYPMVFKICPNRILEMVSTSENEADLYQRVQVCQASLSVGEKADVGSFYIDPITRSLMLENHEAIESLRIIDLQGRVISTYNSVSSNRISLDELHTGVYLFEIYTETTRTAKRLYLN